MKKMYVVRKNSKNNVSYLSLYVDLVYRNLTISFDMATIVELTGLSFEFLNNLKIDIPVCVGSYNKEVK